MTVSPSAPAAKRTFLRKALHYYLEPIRSRLKAKISQKKYAVNAYPKSFGWDWKEINYNRIALVNLLVSKKPDCAYLEIGCASDDLFDSVPALNKTGVDPRKGGNVRKTSDDFFLSNKSQFDVVFIDGLHTYEQVRKDVINSIKFLKPGGWIALHDMLPLNWIEHHVPVVSAGIWTGDVWKVAFELSRTDGIDFKILRIDHGVGVLRLTKDKPALVDLTNELRDKQFSYLYENISKLPVVEWSDAQAWLRGH
jgi:hypothetical protein